MEMHLAQWFVLKFIATQQVKTMEFTSLSVLSNEVNGLKIYPNPTSDVLIVTGEVELKKLYIYSNLGQLVQKHDLQGKQQNCDVSQLTEGHYILKIVDINGNVNASKISIKR